jgi:hypothetical protein
MFVLYICRLRIDHIKNVQERRALPYQVSVWDLEKLISIAREARHVLVFVFSLIPFDFSFCFLVCGLFNYSLLFSR